MSLKYIPSKCSLDGQDCELIPERGDSYEGIGVGNGIGLGWGEHNGDGVGDSYGLHGSHAGFGYDGGCADDDGNGDCYDADVTNVDVDGY